MAYRKDWGQPQTGPMGFAGTQKVIGRVVTLSATDLVTANTVGAFKVPAGFAVTGIIAVATDMDSGATLNLSVGDAASSARYLAAGSALGQAAGSSTTLASAGLLFLNTVDTEILITVVAQGSASVAGTLSLYLVGFMAQ